MSPDKPWRPYYGQLYNSTDYPEDNPWLVVPGGLVSLRNPQYKWDPPPGVFREKVESRKLVVVRPGVSFTVVSK